MAYFNLETQFQPELAPVRQKTANGDGNGDGTAKPSPF